MSLIIIIVLASLIIFQAFYYLKLSLEYRKVITESIEFAEGMEDKIIKLGELSKSNLDKLNSQYNSLNDELIALKLEKFEMLDNSKVLNLEAEMVWFALLRQIKKSKDPLGDFRKALMFINEGTDGQCPMLSTFKDAGNLDLAFAIMADRLN